MGKNISICFCPAIYIKGSSTCLDGVAFEIEREEDVMYLERDEAVVAEVEALQVLEAPQARHLQAKMDGQATRRGRASIKSAAETAGRKGRRGPLHLRR